MNDSKGYYALLNLPATASAREIKAAFHREVKLCHPDKNPSPEARDIYQHLTEAYQVLSDPEKRRAYDATPLAEESSRSFIPCCCCGRKPRQPRFIFFSAGGTRTGGVYCRPCAGKAQFKNAMKNWKNLFNHPLYALKALSDTADLSAMPPDRNYQMLMQNAAAFLKLGRKDRAKSLAKQALRFAETESEKRRADDFAAALPSAAPESDFWKITLSDYIRTYLPLIIFLIIAFSLVVAELRGSFMPTRVADVRYPDHLPVVLFPAPLASNLSLLYKTVPDKTPAFQAPCTDCGLIDLLDKDTVVRITGITPDGGWAQIKTERGIVYYVRRALLQKK